jgi:hypothetical protein
MTPHVNQLLSRFAALYGTPSRAEDLEACLEEYDRALRGYPAAVLSEAGDIVIRENTFRSWPTPGECVAACRHVARRLEQARVRAAPEPERQFRRYGRGTPEYETYLARMRVEDPAYARLIERRGVVQWEVS